MEDITPKQSKNETNNSDQTPGETTSQSTTGNTQPTAMSAVDVALLQEKYKSLKTKSTIMIVVIVALLAGGVVYFIQYNNSQDALKAEQAKTASTQAELNQTESTQAQKTIDDLNKQIETLNKQISDLKVQGSTDTATISKLQADLKECQDAAKSTSTTTQ